MVQPNDSVNLKIIGCGDAFASGGRFNTCFYLNYQESHILVDCGASSLVALKKHKAPLEKIQCIVLTHLHGDHFGGIPFLLLDGQYIQKRAEKLAIIGPTGTEQKVKQLTELLYPGIDLGTFSYKLHFKEYQPFTSFEVDGFAVEAIPVIHSAEAMPHGLRIKLGNKVFAFSGDTEWTENLIEIANGASLFICESNFYSNKAPNHLDYQTILSQKHRLNCEKILLNHLGEEMLNKCPEIELECCYDGQEIIF